MPIARCRALGGVADRPWRCRSPSRARCRSPSASSTIGASAGAGGLSFISRASRPKKAPASIFCTRSSGGSSCRSRRDTGTSAGGVQGSPQALERRQLVLLLQRVDGGVVLRAVRLHLAVDPHEARRRADRSRLTSAGGVPCQPGPAIRKLRGPGAGRALADRREDVAPHVEERDDVVAPAGVRHREHERLLVEVGPGARRRACRARFAPPPGTRRPGSAS